MACLETPCSKWQFLGIMTGIRLLISSTAGLVLVSIWMGDLKAGAEVYEVVLVVLESELTSPHIVLIGLLLGVWSFGRGIGSSVKLLKNGRFFSVQ